VGTDQQHSLDDWRCRICAQPIHDSGRWCTPCRGAWDAAHLHIDQVVGTLREEWWNASPDDTPDTLDAVDRIRYKVREGLSRG